MVRLVYGDVDTTPRLIVDQRQRCPPPEVSSANKISPGSPTCFAPVRVPYAYTSPHKDGDCGRRRVHGGRELATFGWCLRVTGGGFDDSGLPGWLSGRPRLPFGGPNL